MRLNFSAPLADKTKIPIILAWEKTMKKKTKIIMALIVILAIGMGTSMFISTSKFGVSNPLSVMNGLYQISFTNTKYIEIQEYPKVMIAKPTSDNLLIEYMESQGHSEIKEGRMGSILEFTQAEHIDYIDFSVNGFYSLWKWRE